MSILLGMGKEAKLGDARHLLNQTETTGSPPMFGAAPKTAQTEDGDHHSDGNLADRLRPAGFVA